MYFVGGELLGRTPPCAGIKGDYAESFLREATRQRSAAGTRAYNREIDRLSSQHPCAPGRKMFEARPSLPPG